MKHKFTYLLLLAALLAAACEKQIEFKGEVADAQVVMQARLAAGDTISLRLSYSRFFLDASAFRMIDDATLRLTVNGAPVTAATTYHAATGLYTIAYVPQAGDSLAIVATIAGHEPVTASTVIPASPVVDGASATCINSGSEEYGTGRQYNVRFRLHDTEREQNYYLLRFEGTIDRIELDYRNSIFSVDTIVHRDTTYSADSSTVYITVDTAYLRDTILVYDTIAEPIDILFGCHDYLILDQDEISLGNEPTFYELYFTDAKINGLTHDIQTTINLDNLYYDDYSPYGYYDDTPPSLRYDPNSLRLTMYLTSFSRDLYLYSISTEQQASEFGSLFSEPTQIHTNVSNGIGIFAGSNTISLQFQLHD